MSLDLRQQFYNLAIIGKQTEMIDLINQNPEHKFDFNEALFWVCHEEHKEIAELLIKTYGANDFNYALRGACLGGQKEIAKWLIETHRANNFNMALFYACFGMKYKVAEWLVNNYPIDYNRLDKNVKNWVKGQNIVTTSTQVIIESD